MNSEVLDNAKFNNFSGREDYEMDQIQNHNPRLNTKRKTCRQQIDKDNEQKYMYTMTLEEFNTLKHYKRDEDITVNISFTVLEHTHKLRYSFRHSGYMHNSSYVSYKNQKI